VLGTVAKLDWVGAGAFLEGIPFHPHGPHPIGSLHFVPPTTNTPHPHPHRRRSLSLILQCRQVVDDNTLSIMSGAGDCLARPANSPLPLFLMGSYTTTWRGMRVGGKAPFGALEAAFGDPLHPFTVRATIPVRTSLWRLLRPPHCPSPEHCSHRHVSCNHETICCTKGTFLCPPGFEIATPPKLLFR